MSWFPVDDGFHSHPKQTAASLAAVGLWTVAGSWSNHHHTDGFVPDHQVPLLARGKVELAKELVAVGLWRRSKGGYQFHEWTEDGDGSPRNQTRAEAIAKRSRMSSGGALGNHRRWHVDKGKTDPKCPFCQEKFNRPPNRVPDREGESGSESGANPPVPVQSPKGTRTGTSSQSSSRRTARAWADDDDSIDLGIVELLAELTSQQISIRDAVKIRQSILAGRSVKNRGAYVARAIADNPAKFLPIVEVAEPHPDPGPLRVVPEWCGQCESDAYRWLALADDRWAKCPACNPDAKDPFSSREVS